MASFGAAMFDHMAQARQEHGGALSKEEWIDAANVFYRGHCAAHRRPAYHEAADGNANPVYLALCRAECSNPAELTAPEKRRIGLAEVQIRKVMIGCDDTKLADEVASRAKKWKLRYPRATLTANALLNGWASLNGYARKIESVELTVAPPKPAHSDEEARLRAEEFRRMVEQGGIV